MATGKTVLLLLVLILAPSVDAGAQSGTDSLPPSGEGVAEFWTEVPTLAPVRVLLPQEGAAEKDRQLIVAFHGFGSSEGSSSRLGRP